MTIRQNVVCKRLHSKSYLELETKSYCNHAMLAQELTHAQKSERRCDVET